MGNFERNFHDLETNLRECESGWYAAQCHGLLCARLSVIGASALNVCLEQIFEDVNNDTSCAKFCDMILQDVFKRTWIQLVERQSEFTLYLPDDQSSVNERTNALAQWCDGFLHGIVTGKSPKKLKEFLSKEPSSIIIKDMLEITRAFVDGKAEVEENEQAYIEIMEYIRVSAQLIYEELADFRGKYKKKLN
ncbi:MAG TPA: YecA family protein [Woeseiaceae bacterium]|nr:YecA family protein [Woeseiaceae bacterium]|tara:strand:+ start:358 stop:933 length:576 start_codon:yes stop_codon:yes gene_type:complete